MIDRGSILTVSFSLLILIFFTLLLTKAYVPICSIFSPNISSVDKLVQLSKDACPIKDRELGKLISFNGRIKSDFNI